MSHYLLTVVQPTHGEISSEDLAAVMERVTAVDTAMVEAGVKVYSGGLEDPDQAQVLRAEDGTVTATDGPFLEAVEFVGGFTIVDVPDDAAARDWGGRVAVATGLPVEVRRFRW